MADMLTVLENCRISPPPATVTEQSLPLTFFDMMWLPFFPINQTNNSSNVSRKPEIRYVEGDSLVVSFAEGDLDFDDLVGNHPRACDMFHPLVPRLERATYVSDHLIIPLFSVQVTLFPNKGISVGLTNRHVLCDASTRFDFLKAWTFIFKHGTDELFLASGSLPFYDRAIKYPGSLDEIYLNHPEIESIGENYQPPHLGSCPDKVRATFVLTREQINRLKKWVSIQKPTLEYISSFSVACGFVWSCIAKSSAEVGEKKGEDDLERFICVVDWRTRLNPPVPQIYFGNCVGVCETAKTKSIILSGSKGFLTALELIGKAISETVKNRDGMLKDAETWMDRGFDPMPTLSVAGTPKIKIYDTEFGWGRPKKYETISIDHNGSISVNACAESPKDIEIGLSLPAKQMDAKGFLTALELIGKAISETVKNRDGMLKDVETWMDRGFDPMPTLSVAGTPKIKIYDTDFGWERPKKYETISIDHNGSISVNACAESPEDIEIGLSFPAKQMDAFISISRNELQKMC
ncbi:Chloramphenicol acetyltransferase-like domain-containing protein [Artemisia annua]|uniref:Chloramphenicol acetyltransferase-like domain-containing protein n=1 Tax=Artemisia annua TaxID=35608 RepID=A0A2U1MAW0_ARTAN|nr:Chloramphenicol acetyltransferase-like domain-containing protein [Artemisia annua]